VCLNCTTYSTAREKKQQLYHLNVIISPQNITDLKTLKPWCSICTIASPARISIHKAEGPNQLHAQPTVQIDAHPPPREKTKWVTLCHRNLGLCHGFLSMKRTRLLYEHEIYQKFLKHAKSIWQIFYSRYCVWLLVRLSLTHWLITWFHLIYKISKSSCNSSIPMIANLAMQYKEEEKKKKKSDRKASKSFFL